MAAMVCNLFWLECRHHSTPRSRGSRARRLRTPTCVWMRDRAIWGLPIAPPYRQRGSYRGRGLAHQNRAIAIASDFRVDGAKSPDIPQKGFQAQKLQIKIANR